MFETETENQLDVQKKIQKAQQLIKDVQKLSLKWEGKNFKVKGVSNVSKSDLGSLELYAKTFIRNGGNFYGLMDPVCEVAEVLRKYQII